MAGERKGVLAVALACGLLKARRRLTNSAAATGRQEMVLGITSQPHLPLCPVRGPQGEAHDGHVQPVGGEVVLSCKHVY